MWRRVSSVLVDRRENGGSTCAYYLKNYMSDISHMHVYHVEDRRRCIILVDGLELVLNQAVKYSPYPLGGPIRV